MQLISQLKPFGSARTAVSKLRVLALMFAWVLIGAGAASAQTLVDFSKSFSPSIVASGDTTTLSYFMLNNAGGSKESIGFTETLPAGLVIATPSNASTNCAAGTSPNTTLTATSGTSVITLDAIGDNGNGITGNVFQLVGDICQVLVDVTPTTSGTFTATSGTLFADGAPVSISTAVLSSYAAIVTAPSIAQAFSPDTINPGARSTHTVTIDRAGATGIATGLAFTHTFAAGITLVGSPTTDCRDGVLSGAMGESTISLSGGQLAGSSCSITTEVTSSTAGVNTSTTITLSGSFLSNPVSPTADLTVNAASAFVGFSKSFSPSTVNQNGVSTLTYTIDNSASVGDVRLISFAETLPTGLIIASPANVTSGCPLGTSGITASAGTSTISKTGDFSEILAAGATCTISVDVQATDGGTFTATSGDLTYRNAISFQNENAGPSTAELKSLSSELLLSKSFTTNPVVVGGTTTIEYTIDNNSRDNAASAVAFTDSLAAFAGVTFTGLPSSNCGGTLSMVPDSISISGGSIPASGSCTISVGVAVASGVSAGSIVSTSGAVTGTAGGVNITGNTAAATLIVSASPPPTLSITAPGGLAGSPITVTLELTNNSTTGALTDGAFQIPLQSVISGATVSNLPAASSCGTGSQFSVFDVGGFTTLSVVNANLVANSSCTVTFDLTAPAGTGSGSYTLTSTTISGTLDGAAVVASGASGSFNIGEPGFDLSFVKTFDTSSITAAGGTVNAIYTITPDSANGVGATAINFTDLFASETAGTTINAVAATSTCGGAITGAGDLDFDGGAIALGGAACVITVPVTFPASLATGTLTSETTLLNATGNTATSFGTASADLLVTSTTLMVASATLSPSSVIPGQTTDFVVTFDNSAGIEAVTDLVFTANLDGAISGAVTNGTATTTCTGTSSLSGTDFVVLVGGELAAGASCQTTIPIVVPAAAADQETTFSTSNISFTQGAISQTASAVGARLTVQGAQLLATKTFADDSVVAGTSASMTIAIQNLSASAVTNVNFTDDLTSFLAGAAFTTLSDSGCVGSVGTSTATLFTSAGFGIAANGTCSIVLGVAIPAGTTPGTYTSTTSALTGDIGGLTITGDAAFDSLQVTNGLSPVFSMAFTPSTLDVAAAGSVTYTIANPVGGSALSNLRFSSDLGSAIAGITVTGTSGSCGTGSTFASTTVAELAGGVLAAGETCTLIASFTVAAAGGGQSYTSTTSTLTSNGLVLAPEASATLAVNDVPPTLAKSFAAASFPQGGSTTLTYTIDHSGSSNTVTGLNFTDILPINVVVAATPAVTSTCGAISAVAGTGNISLTGGTVAANSTCLITVPVTSDVAVPSANIATSGLSSDVGNSPAASASLAVTAAPVPTYTAAALPATIAQGASTVLTFTIDNSGSLLSATGLATSYTTPVGLVTTGVATTCGIGLNPSPAGFTLSGGSVAAGASCTITVSTTAFDAGAFTPTGTALTTSLGNAVAASPSLTVTPAPIPTMTAVFNPTSIVQGLTSNLILRFDNTGLVPATGLTFNIPLPAGFTTTSSGPANTCGGTLITTVGGSSISLSGGTIAPTAQCTIGLTVKSSLEGAATFNAGVVTSSLGTIVAATAPITVTAAPAPSIAITANPSNINEGLTSRIDIVVTNNANVGITGGAISTTLPAGLVIADAATLTNCTGATLSGAMGDSTFAITGATIDVGRNCLMRANVRATSGGVKTIPSGDFTSNLTTAPSVNGTLTVTPAPVPISSLILAETTFSEGGNTQVVTHINNLGASVDATALSFTNTLPTGLVVAADPLVVNTCSGGTLTAVAGASSYSYSGGTLAAASTCFINVRVASVTANIYNITISDMTSSIGTTSPAMATLTVTPAPVPAVTMISSTPTIAQGGITRLTLNIANTAAFVPATNVAGTFGFPIGFGPAPVPNVFSTCSGGTVLPAPGGVAASIPSIAAGATCSVAFDITGITVGGTTLTTGDITSDLGNSGPASTNITVTAAGIPMFTKVFTTSPVVQGQPTTMTFTIDNSTALIAATGGTILDTFPSGMLVAATPNYAGSCDDATSTVGTSTFTVGADRFGVSGITVGAGASCTYAVDVVVNDAGSFTNTTNPLVTSLGNSGAAVATLVVTAAPIPGFTKSFAAASIVQGDVTRLTFALDNTSALVGLTGAGFTDTFPVGMVIAPTPNVVNGCSAGTITSVVGADTFTLLGGAVAAATSCEIAVDVTSSTVGNAVNTSGVMTSSLGVTPAGGATATLAVTSTAAVGFTKVYAPDSIVQGAVSTATYTIDNSAALIQATGLNFSDTLPSGVSVAAVPNASSTCVGPVIVATAGATSVALTDADLAAGATCTLSVDVTGVTVGASTVATGLLEATFAGTAVTSPGASTTLTVTAATAPTVAAAFAPATIVQGGITTFSITIDNAAALIAAETVAFINSFPTGVKVAATPNISTTCGGTLSANAGASDIFFNGGSIAAGASCVVSVDVTSATVGAVTNTSREINSSLGSSGTATAPLTVTAAAAPTVAAAFAPTSIAQGGITTLSLTIDNASALIAAETVAFANTFPTGVTIAATPNISSSCDGTLTAAAGAANMSLAGGLIAAGASCVLSVDVTSATAGAVTNTTGDITSSLGNSSTAAASLTVTAATAPTVAASFAPATIAQGGITTLSLTIDNASSLIAAETVAFANSFPTGVTVAATPNTSSSCGGTFTAAGAAANMSFSGGSIAAGASCVVSFDVSSVTSGGLTHTSGAVTSSLGNSGTASASLTVTAASAPGFTNRFDPAQIAQGGRSNLIFTVDNLGRLIPANNLGFTANLPAGLQVAGAAGSSFIRSAAMASGSSTCGGTLTAVAGATTVSLSGGSVAATSTCQVSVPVTSVTTGTVGPVTASLTSSNGGTALDTTGSAPLVVVVDPTGNVTFVQNVSEDGAYSFSSSVSALNFTINATGGTGQAGPIQVNAGTYVISQSRPAGVGNTSLSCSDANSTVDKDSGTVTLNLEARENVTCTYSSVNSGQEATETINAFLQRRNNLLLSNGPNRGRRLARLAQGELGGSQTLSFQQGDLNALVPGTFNLRSIEAGNVNLSTSLIQVEHAHTMFLLANDLDADYVTTVKNRRFDVWFEAHYSKFKASGGSGGHFGLAYLGADYLIDQNTLAGVILQFDSLDDTNATTGNRVDGTGWMIGPYLTKRLAPNLIFDGRFALGKSSNDLTTTTSTGNFDTTRMLFDVNLSGNFDWKSWIVSPNLNISYIEDDQAAFFDSLNVLVPSQKVSLGQIKFGPTFSTTFMGKNHMRYEPSISLNGIYNFSNTSGVNITNNTADESDGLRGRIEASMRMTNRHGTQIELGANYDGIGKSEFESWGLKFGVTIPLQ